MGKRQRSLEDSKAPATISGTPANHGRFGIIVEEDIYTGPLPDPQTLAKYDAIVPGAAQTIIGMAKLEQEHRHRQEDDSGYCCRTQGKGTGAVDGFLFCDHSHFHWGLADRTRPDTGWQYFRRWLYCGNCFFFSESGTRQGRIPSEEKINCLKSDMLGFCISNRRAHYMEQ